MNDNARQLYQIKAQVLQAIAHPLRLAIVDCLATGEQCVCDIAAHVAAQRSNVSRHLALMNAAGVVASRKDGLKVLYRLNCPCLASFFACVDQVLLNRMREASTLLESLEHTAQTT